MIETGAWPARTGVKPSSRDWTRTGLTADRPGSHQAAMPPPRPDQSKSVHGLPHRLLLSLVLAHGVMPASTSDLFGVKDAPRPVGLRFGVCHLALTTSRGSSLRFSYIRRWGCCDLARCVDHPSDLRVEHLDVSRRFTLDHVVMCPGCAPFDVRRAVWILIRSFEPSFEEGRVCEPSSSTTTVGRNQH
jgi:hypothetical protein